jgi:hypothetical protein
MSLATVLRTRVSRRTAVLTGAMLLRAAPAAADHDGT